MSAVNDAETPDRDCSVGHHCTVPADLAIELAKCVGAHDLETRARVRGAQRVGGELRVNCDDRVRVDRESVSADRRCSVAGGQVVLRRAGDPALVVRPRSLRVLGVRARAVFEVVDPLLTRGRVSPGAARRVRTVGQVIDEAAGVDEIVEGVRAVGEPSALR